MFSRSVSLAVCLLSIRPSVLSVCPVCPVCLSVCPVCLVCPVRPSVCTSVIVCLYISHLPVCLSGWLSVFVTHQSLSGIVVTCTSLSFLSTVFTCIVKMFVCRSVIITHVWLFHRFSYIQYSLQVYKSSYDVLNQCLSGLIGSICKILSKRATYFIVTRSTKPTRSSKPRIFLAVVLALHGFRATEKCLHQKG